MLELEPCNKCGKMPKSEFFNESTKVELLFQYGSRKDGDSMRFRLCDDCLDEITATFKVKPSTIEDSRYSDWSDR